MQLCDKHDECYVIYSSRECPICDEINLLEVDKERLEEQVVSLKDEITEMETK